MVQEFVALLCQRLPSVYVTEMRLMDANAVSFVGVMVESLMPSRVIVSVASASFVRFDVVALRR